MGTLIPTLRVFMGERKSCFPRGKVWEQHWRHLSPGLQPTRFSPGKESDSDPITEFGGRKRVGTRACDDLAAGPLRTYLGPEGQGREVTWPPLRVAETRGAPTLPDALNEQSGDRLAARDRLAAVVTMAREVGAGLAESGRCGGLSRARLWGARRDPVGARRRGSCWRGRVPGSVTT